MNLLLRLPRFISIKKMTGMTGSLFLTKKQHLKSIHHYNINIMKKQFRLFAGIASFFTLVMVLPAIGQAPPPPSHGQNGNQTRPGSGTGCPVDQTNGIVFTFLACIGYAGFMLYSRSNKKVERS